MMTTTTEALSEVLRVYGRADEMALASLLEVSDWESHRSSGAGAPG